MPAAPKNATKPPGLIDSKTVGSRANQVINANAAETKNCISGEASALVASSFRFCILLLSLALKNLLTSYSSPPKALTSL